MNERYIVTVDLGTSNITLCVTRITEGETGILFYKQTPSKGIRNGRVFNAKMASEALKEAVSEAENELGLKISQVVIGLPRYFVRQESASATLERSGEESWITQEEVDTLKFTAQNNYELENPAKQEIYGIVAQAFNTDTDISLPESDVVGMTSEKLEGNFRIFVGDKASSSNIDLMLNLAGIAPVCKYFTPITTAEAVLTPDEKDNGVALFELGAGVSSVTIFQGGLLRYYASIPFGGLSITQDIKYECSFKEVLAENIKMAFGSCMPDKLQNMADKILQINNEETGASKQLTVKYLSEIITARSQEIYDALLFHIQASGLKDKLRSGIVLTGGGANLTNTANFLKEMSGYHVRIGFPKLRKMIADGVSGINDPAAATSVGMTIFAAANEHINCSGEYVKPAEKLKEDDYSGTVFGEITPEKPEDVKKIRKPKVQKVTWGQKIIQKVGSGVGTLFDDAASEE